MLLLPIVLAAFLAVAYAAVQLLAAAFWGAFMLAASAWARGRVARNPTTHPCGPE